MTVEAQPRRGIRSAGTASSKVSVPDGGRWYSVGGLGVWSEFELPIPSAPEPDELSSVLRIERGEPRDCLARPISPNEATVPTDGATASQPLISHWFDGGWWWWDAACVFNVSPDARRVSVYPLVAADELTVGTLLMGPIISLVLSQRGFPTLHTSAIVVRGEAIAFAGQKGQGKSTLASLFLRRGAALLTDDLLPIIATSDGIRGVPGPARLKVDDEVARDVWGLSPRTIEPVAPGRPKKLLPATELVAHCDAPVPLRAIYLIDRYGEEETAGPGITSWAVPIHGVLETVLPHVILSQFPTVMRQVLPALARMAAQVPVRRIRFPSGFEHGEAVYSYISREMGWS